MGGSCCPGQLVRAMFMSSGPVNQGSPSRARPVGNGPGGPERARAGPPPGLTSREACPLASFGSCYLGDCGPGGPGGASSPGRRAGRRKSRPSGVGSPCLTPRKGCPTTPAFFKARPGAIAAARRGGGKALAHSRTVPRRALGRPREGFAGPAARPSASLRGRRGPICPLDLVPRPRHTPGLGNHLLIRWPALHAAVLRFHHPATD